MKKLYIIGLISLIVFSVKAQDQSKEDNKESRNRKRSYGTNQYFKIDLGLNNYLENGKFPDQNNALYSVKPWGSWYVALNFINRTHIKGPFNLEWGGGVSWYNFKFENADTRIAKTNTSTIFFTDQRDISAIKSKLTATYVNVSLVPVIDFGRPTRFTNHGGMEVIFLSLTGKEKEGFELAQEVTQGTVWQVIPKSYMKILETGKRRRRQVISF